MNKEDKSKLELIGEIAQANNKNLELIEEINDLQKRIDKAIEYIENNSSKYDRTGDGYTFLDEDEIEPLLKILGGKE